MNLRTPESSDRNIPRDVGTLWMLRRSGHAVRCALVAWSSEWEVRILVDGVILLAERCPRGAGAFRLAELWKDRMVKEGWQIPTRRQLAPQFAEYLGEIAEEAQSRFR